MRLLALLGYPRVDGHTARMTELFLAGARKAGAEIKRHELAQLDITPCKGCYHCWLKTPGSCVCNDDMAGILKDYLESDLLLLASPLYAFSIAAHLKQTMERTLPLLEPGVEKSFFGNIERNRLRFPGMGPKRMAGILVGGLKSLENFQPAAESMRFYAAGFGVACAGILLRPESYLLQFPVAKPKRFKFIEAAFQRAGREFVLRENIEEQTIRAAAEPLIADMEHFVRYADVYWEHARLKPDDPAAAGVAALEDLRILMREMARNINPVATRGTKAILQFEFPDRGWIFCLSLCNSVCRFIEGACEQPDLSISCPSHLWAGVLLRRYSGAKAMAHPQCRVTGNSALLQHFNRWFHSPP